MAHQNTKYPLTGIEVQDQREHYAVFDHGAHVWAWTPRDGEPVLWMSERSAFEAGSPIRGGIPVCFPWFGPGREGNQQPAHGFARLVEWRRMEVLEDEGSTVVEFELDERITGEQPQWPHPYRANLRVSFGSDALDVALTVTNTGDQTITFEEALHTYLRVGDARAVGITGLEDVEYLDKVAGTWATQTGEVTITAETDRVYLSTADVVLADGTGRELHISKRNSANTVVWNPWVDKSRAMPDFGDDEWTRMVCIEAANALEDAITLEPGGSHTMAQRIELK